MLHCECKMKKEGDKIYEIIFIAPINYYNIISKRTILLLALRKFRKSSTENAVNAMLE